MFSLVLNMFMCTLGVRVTIAERSCGSVTSTIFTNTSTWEAKITLVPSPALEALMKIGAYRWLFYRTLGNNTAEKIIDKQNSFNLDINKYSEDYSEDNIFLRIRNLTQYDAGLYFVNCWGSVNQYNSDRTEIVVQDITPTVRAATPSRTLSEGKESDITCRTTGRPPQEIHFVYNNTRYTSNVNTTTYDDVDKIYTVQSIFTRTFSRYDNGKQLFCVTMGSMKSIPVTLNVLFPPLTVNFEATTKSSDDEANTTLVIQCITGESNPVSTVSWTGKEEVPNKLLSSNKALFASMANYHGYILSKTMEFNLSYKDIGRKISCDVENPTFPEVKLSKSYTYTPEYRPFISVPAGPIVSIVKGNSITIACIVYSNPTGQILWYKMDDLKVGEVASTNPGILNLHIPEMSLSDAANYSCVANNGVGDEQTTMIVLAISNYPEDGSGDDSSSSVGLIAAIVGVLFVVLIAMIVIVFVVTRRRRKNNIDIGRAAYVAEGGANQQNVDAVEDARQVANPNVNMESVPIQQRSDTASIYTSLQNPGTVPAIDIGAQSEPGVATFEFLANHEEYESIQIKDTSPTQNDASSTDPLYTNI